MNRSEYHKNTAESYKQIPAEFLLTRHEGMYSTIDPRDTPGGCEVNSLGYRSPEFDGTAGLVTLGCSQTHGSGVQNGSNWPYLLAEKLDLKLANLAVVGSSIQAQLDVLLSYMNTYGRPKVVAFLAPNLERLRIPVRTDVIVASNKQEEPNTDYLYAAVHTNLEIRESNTEVIPSYAKKPYDMFDILPYEFAVAESIRALSHIGMICKVSGIRFVFASWHPISNQYLSDLANRLDPNTWEELDMSNYVDVVSDEEFFKQYANLDCHEDSLNVDGVAWAIGADRTRHMGRHHHIHVAEAFYGKIQSSNEVNK